jgi:ribosomal protein L30/L7E
LRPDASSKGTIVMGNVHPSVSNWCPNDNLRTKGRIESRCGMYVYLFLQINNSLCLLGLFRIYHILFLQSNNSLCLLGLFRIYHTLFLQSNNSLCLLGLFRIYHILFLQINNSLCLLGLFRIYHILLWYVCVSCEYLGQGR